MPEFVFDQRLVKAVIFDVDGTLYRQAPLRRAMAMRLVRAHLLHPLRGRRTMRALNAYRDAQETLRTVPGQGDLAEAQLRVAAERSGLDQATVAREVARWMEVAPLPLLPRCSQPGLEDLLQSLRSRGVLLAVLSDYDPGPKLDAMGIAQYFDVVVFAQQPEVGVFKPHPRGLQVTLERLGVGCEEALYIGDRVDVDAAAAAATGIPCAILGDPEPQARSDRLAYFPISSFHDIRDRLVPT